MCMPHAVHTNSPMRGGDRTEVCRTHKERRNQGCCFNIKTPKGELRGGVHTGLKVLIQQVFIQ